MKLKQIIGRENKEGFTLVELIVVMAILAVLAAVAVPRFAGVIGDSHEKADAINKKMIEDAVEMSYAAGVLPKAADGNPTGDLMPLLAENNYLKDEVIPLPNDATKKYTVTVEYDGNGKIEKINIDSTAIPVDADDDQ